jgi:hypothetical protein
MPLTHARVRLQGTGPAIPAVRRESHDHPLLGFHSPSGFDPLVPPRASRRPAPLLGFSPLQRMSVGRVYVTSACGPIRRLRSVPRVWALSTVCSSTHLATSFDAAALVGFSLQGFPLSNRPMSSSLVGLPSWCCSRGLRSLLLGKERTVGARTGCLGAYRPHLCVTFRALLRSRVRTAREHG